MNKASSETIGVAETQEKGCFQPLPTEVFNRLQNNQGTIGDAVQALKQGFPISRKGWNGKGLFIFMQVPSTVDYEFVPKMSSLPDPVKYVLEQRHQNGRHNADVDPLCFNSIRYQNQLAMVSPDNSIFGWVASPSDLLSEDWGYYN